MEHYPLDELKLIYRVLHGSLAEHVELLDARLFEDLQTLLHRRARAEGIDVADHAAWDAWLGNAPAGRATRAASRRVSG